MVPENKQKKKVRTKTKLAFKMIPILHNTLLATSKLKFYSGAIANFWGPPNPATKIFMGQNSNFTLGAFVLLRRLPKSNFTLGAFAHFGGHWALWGSGAQNQMLLWGHLFFWEGPETLVLRLGLLPIFGAHQTKQPPFLWAQTQILLWGNLSFWGVSQTQILLRGLLPILGAYWGLLLFRGPKSNFRLGR
jgi:hypothetical protein